MDIDSEHLGIPDNEYDATVKLPAAEFQRIVKDLATIGDTVEVSVTKDAVQFATSGDIGSANIMCRQNKTADKPEDSTEIDITEPVALTFALRYLNSFAKVWRAPRLWHFWPSAPCPAGQAPTSALPSRRREFLATAWSCCPALQATPLSTHTVLKLSKELPVVVEYRIGELGKLCYYLAPVSAGAPGGGGGLSSAPCKGVRQGRGWQASLIPFILCGCRKLMRGRRRWRPDSATAERSFHHFSAAA